jgi:hypothetical protein
MGNVHRISLDQRTQFKFLVEAKWALVCKHGDQSPDILGSGNRWMDKQTVSKVLYMIPCKSSYWF